MTQYLIEEQGTGTDNKEEGLDLEDADPDAPFVLSELIFTAAGCE